MTRENFINVKWEIIVFIITLTNSETLCDENDYFNINECHWKKFLISFIQIFSNGTIHVVKHELCTS